LIVFCLFRQAQTHFGEKNTLSKPSREQAQQKKKKKKRKKKERKGRHNFIACICMDLFDLDSSSSWLDSSFSRRVTMVTHNQQLKEKGEDGCQQQQRVDVLRGSRESIFTLILVEQRRNRHLLNIYSHLYLLRFLGSTRWMSYWEWTRREIERERWQGSPNTWTSLLIILY
jgi:hypothetical protein